MHFPTLCSTLVSVVSGVVLMVLIGMLDSPYVRRVAVSCKRLGVPFEHRAVSVFRHVDAFAAVNPLVKAPTLVADDGTVLMDSTLILQHVAVLAGRDLMPRGETHTRALRICGLALAACEKGAQGVYEHQQRPPEKLHAPWLARVTSQLDAAWAALEHEVSRATATPWLCGDVPMQPDIDVAIAWTFAQFNPEIRQPGDRYAALAAFVARVEALPELASTPLD